MSDSTEPRPEGHDDPTAPSTPEPFPTPPSATPDQPTYGQPSYEQPTYHQPSYGQPSYGQPAYGQVPPPPAPGADPYPSTPPPPGQPWGPPPPPQVGEGQPAGPPATDPYGQYVPGAYPGTGGQPYAQPYPGTYGAPARSNGSLIALTVVSGISIVSCCNILGIPALILGIIGLSKNTNDPEGAARLGRYGWIAFAAGIVLAFVGIALLFAFGTFSEGGGSSFDGY